MDEGDGVIGVIDWLLTMSAVGAGGVIANRKPADEGEGVVNFYITASDHEIIIDCFFDGLGVNF